MSGAHRIAHWRMMAVAMAIALFAQAPLAQDSAAGVKSAIPFKTEPSPVESHGGNVGLAVLLLCVAAAATVYVAKRKLPGIQLKNSRRMRVVEQTRLNARCTLYLVEIDKRELVVAQCGDNVVTLDPPAPPAEGS